jgi:hypothetical protein
VVLIFLLTGTAYSEQLPNKPFKVCPEVVTAKDTPCRVLGPTAAIVHRVEKEDPRDKEILELKEKLKQMEEMIRVLQSK